MFLWSLHLFWTFTPLSWFVALIWNICELLHVSLPFAPQAFGIIMGHQGKCLPNSEKGEGE